MQVTPAEKKKARLTPRFLFASRLHRKRHHIA
jgi:hypothetical protein